MSFFGKLKEEFKEHAEDLKSLVEEHKDLVRLVPGALAAYN